MSTAFVRGAHTMNSMFFKPIARKGYHKKSSSPDSIKEAVELEAKEMKSQGSNMGDGDSNLWAPDDRTGIYCPKGKEKVLDNIPPKAVKDLEVNFFYNENC